MNNENEPLLQQRYKLEQNSIFNWKYFAIACQLCFAFGILKGFSTLPQRLDPKRNFSMYEYVNLNENSRLVSGEMLGQITALLEGLLCDIYGRRSLMRYSSFLHAFSWAIISTTFHNDSMYFANALLPGVVSGFSWSALLYIMETTPAKSRGFLFVIALICQSMGILLANVIGYASIFYSLFALIVFLQTLMMPESRAWSEYRRRRPNSFTLTFDDDEIGKTFIAMSVLRLLLAQIAYIGTSSIIYATTTITSGLTLCLFISFFKRRTIVIFCLILVGLATLYVQVLQTPAVALFLMASIGADDVSSLVTGEAFPTRIRGTVCSVLACLVFITNSVNLSLYRSYLASVTGHRWFYACLCFVAVCQCGIFMPETKDKDLRKA